jgi:hypothetical protein
VNNHGYHKRKTQLFYRVPRQYSHLWIKYLIIYYYVSPAPFFWRLLSTPTPPNMPQYRGNQLTVPARAWFLTYLHEVSTEQTRQSPVPKKKKKKSEETEKEKEEGKPEICVCLYCLETRRRCYRLYKASGGGTFERRRNGTADPNGRILDPFR